MGEAPPADTGGAPSPWEQHAPARRGARVAALVALAAGAALLAGWLAGEGRGAGELAVDERTEAMPPDDAGAAVPVVAAGGLWIARQPAPLEAPGAHRAVWTGDALVAWGGDGEAAAYDLHDRRWWPMAPAPSGPALGPVLAWTGSETLVWGGQLREGGWGAGGAALDHREGTWRVLPDAPVALARPVAAWTGEEFVLWGTAAGPGGGDGPGAAGVAEGQPAGLALDPAAGRWRVLEPAPVESVQRAAGVWTGSELLVWGHDAGGGAFALAYAPRGPDPPAPGTVRGSEPQAGGWRRLSTPPLSNPARAAAAWTDGERGGELVLWGRPLSGLRGSAPPAGAALDPQADRWRLLPDAPGYDWTGSGWGVHGLRATWTGERVIIVGGYPESVTLAYEPATDSWLTLPELPGVIDPVLEWTGEFVSSAGVPRRGELLLWGGYGPFGPTVSLSTWRTVGLGPTSDARLNMGP